MAFKKRIKESRGLDVCKLHVVSKRTLKTTYRGQYMENDVIMTLVGSKFYGPPRQAPYARKQKKKDFVIFHFSEIQQIYHIKKKAYI